MRGFPLLAAVLALSIVMAVGCSQDSSTGPSDNDDTPSTGTLSGIVESAARSGLEGVAVAITIGETTEVPNPIDGTASRCAVTPALRAISTGSGAPILSTR